jgi:hypothetical protein
MLSICFRAVHPCKGVFKLKSAVSHHHADHQYHGHDDLGEQQSSRQQHRFRQQHKYIKKFDSILPEA